MALGPGRPIERRTAIMTIASLFILQTLLFIPAGIGLKPLQTQETLHSPISLVRDVDVLGDFDQDGYLDIYMTMPTNSTYGNDTGAVYIFWGSEDGFPALDPFNADLILLGEVNFLFGQDIQAWDYSGDNWDDLVIGCPGADNGTGKILIYESTDINIAAKGTVMMTSSATLEIQGNNTHFFGSHLEIGDMTGDDLDDLIVLSTKGDTEVPRFEMFSGGVIPEFGYEIELPPNSVTNNTQTATLDLYGTGRDEFVYSSPDSGEVRIIEIDVSFTPYSLPGANSTGVVDFQGSISTTGDTWGWGAGDDGWDTSPTHIYDANTGYDSVRYNQATGNAGSADRSVVVENQLLIEIGGVLGNSADRDMSGAYGTSFTLGTGDITGINSALLAFDWEYEGWGFEATERLWIKARLTDSSGDLIWLGNGLDRNPEADLTPEIFSRVGVGNPGVFTTGTGRHTTDILTLIDGPGEYYLDIGGKISEWTTSSEFAAFGIDNITLTFRTLSHDVKKITGSGGLGSGLFTNDVNDDGWRDLLVGSPIHGSIRVFAGNQPYWKGLPGINQGMDNSTIEGTPNSGLGTSMAGMDVSPFTLSKALVIGAPAEVVDTTSVGRVYVFDLPLAEGSVSVGIAREKNDALSDTKYYGWSLLSVGDQDSDAYPELIIVSWTWEDLLKTTLVDRSPSPPKLWILNPRRHDTVSGHINIIARVFDQDNDTTPEDVRFYRSNDNRSWNPIGDGTADEIIDDIAKKYWNTTLFPNGGYFLKVSARDSFGMEVEMYTDRVDVLNHDPPAVNLIYPADGTELRWDEDITAKVFIPSAEELSPPVRFFFSRDNSTWIEYLNLSSPIQGSSNDYIATFQTEEHDDGPIWFRVNASTVYGLGSEARNIAPAFINNYYSPEGEILRPYSNSTISGDFNISVRTFDLDGDIKEPVQVFYKIPQEETWNLIGNMIKGLNGTYSFLWDTTSVDNGEYDLMVIVEDDTSYKIELRLNDSFRVHNLYQPKVTITTHQDDDLISSLERLSAVIEDRDMNIQEKSIRFLYRPEGLDLWNTIEGTKLIGNITEVYWETTLVMNGLYDLRVEITDDDNLTAMDQVSNIRVKNVYAPILEPSFPQFNHPISGVVRLYFNITDDEPIPSGNILVEVLTPDGWVDLGPVSRTSVGGAFVPNVPIEYYIDWNTLAKDETTKRIFPDSPGYDVRITVTDSDGEVDSYKTPVSYNIKNNAGTIGDDDDTTSDLGIPGWLIAVIGLAIMVIIILIFLIFVFRGDKKTRKPLPKVMPPMEVGVPPEDPAPQETLTPVETRDGGIYSPPGWDSATADLPVEDVPMFTAGSDTSTFGLDLDIEEEDEEDLTSLRDLMFAEKGRTGPRKAPRPPKVKTPKKMKPARFDDTIDVDLPAGVMPTQLMQEPRIQDIPEEEEWGDVDEWQDSSHPNGEATSDVEEWDDTEEEEWEEMEDDEDWEDVDEDEWEDDEDEEEEDIVVVCKCGEEIEIPSDFTGTKFRCPNCGRKGKIHGR